MNARAGAGDDDDLPVQRFRTGLFAMSATARQASYSATRFAYCVRIIGKPKLPSISLSRRLGASTTVRSAAAAYGSPDTIADQTSRSFARNLVIGGDRLGLDGRFIDLVGRLARRLGQHHVDAGRSWIPSSVNFEAL